MHVCLGYLADKKDDFSARAIIKAKEWHKNNFLIVWKMNEKLSMIGWLSKEEVESYPITPKGENKFTKYASARVIDLSDLNTSETFLTKLREAKAKMFRLNSM